MKNTVELGDERDIPTRNVRSELKSGLAQQVYKCFGAYGKCYAIVLV